jgi:outer membrane lipoprotein-sorting protein
MRLFLPFAVLILAALPSRSDGPRFEDLATSQVADLQATVSVVRADQSELRKISKDFGMAYRLKSVTLRFKRPGKLRMEGKIGQESAVYIVNGSTRYYSIPKFGISSRDNLGDSPGRRYSLLEVGILSRGDLAAVQSKHLRSEEIDGAKTQVFEVTYKGDDSVRYVLWVDPAHQVVRRRDWYDSESKLKASFIHREPKEVAPGLWVPTRLEVRNGDGALAASAEYTEIKINQNLADNLFAIRG